MAAPEGSIYSKAFNLWGKGEEQDGVHVGQWHWYDEAGLLVFTRQHQNGKPLKDTYCYPGTDISYVEMDYNEKGVGAPTVYIDPDKDWQSRLQNFVNRNPEQIPLAARKLTKVPGAYPLAYTATDAEGRVLSAAGTLYDKKLLSRLKKVLKAKPDADALGATLEAFQELMSAISDEQPLARASLSELAASTVKVSDMKAYKDVRKRILSKFGETL